MTWFLATLAHLIRLATPLLQTYGYGLWGLFGLLLAAILGSGTWWLAPSIPR